MQSRCKQIGTSNNCCRAGTTAFHCSNLPANLLTPVSPVFSQQFHIAKAVIHDGGKIIRLIGRRVGTA